MSSATPRAPGHLSRESKTWWKQVVNDYELAPHHLKLLQAACEAWDSLVAARLALAEGGTTMKDRFGTERARPQVKMELDSRQAFWTILRHLDLEGESLPLTPHGARAR